MKRIVVANWKEHPLTLEAAKHIVSGVVQATRRTDKVETVIAPPVVFIPELSKRFRSAPLAWGVQTIAHEKEGAYTGEVSAAMVKPYGVTYAIVGHSERRALGETNELVARKVGAAIRSGLRVVLCIGEHERSHDGAYMHVVREELTSATLGLTEREVARLRVAYEPIWAIGKSAGEAITTGELLEMVLYIRKILTECYSRKVAARVPVLYGGSVKAENAALFLTEGGTDGLLVGSASLNPNEFSSIISAVAHA